MKIILASGSPRRNQILYNLGIPFKKVVADSMEKNHVDPSDCSVACIAMENATAKAESAVKAENNEPGIYIGADTVVVLDGKILPKPVDKKDAAAMLEKLSGRTHSVITGIALTNPRENMVTTGFEETMVTFRDLSKKDIELYVETGEPLDKAGAYGIQGYGAFLVEKIDGDYPNVVGLPLMKLYRMMLETGIDLFRISAGTGHGIKSIF